MAYLTVEALWDILHACKSREHHEEYQYHPSPEIPAYITITGSLIDLVPKEVWNGRFAPFAHAKRGDGSSNLFTYRQNMNNWVVICRDS
jgi:hypothetical protein